MGGTNATRERRWPGATSVAARRTCCARPAHLDRRRERQPDQPVRGRLDDHERVAVDEDVARLGQVGRQRAHRPRRRVVAADRAVVGVGHRDGAVGQHRHPERVLEQSLVGGPVAVAEVEQALPDGRGDQPFPHLAQRGRLGVGHPQHPVAHRKPRGLGEERLGGRPVAQPLVGGARPRGRRTGGRVPRPELVVARHRHHRAPVPPGQVPRRRQLGRGRSRRDPLAELGAGARHRGDGAVGQPDPAQGVVDAVGDQHVAVREEEQPQRLVESGCQPVHQTRARPCRSGAAP